MSRQYMTLGFYTGFNDMFRPTFDIKDYEGNAVFGDTKAIKQLAKDRVIANENDQEGLEEHLKKEGVLHSAGQLISGVQMDRALSDMVTIDLEPMDDEKRFFLAWNTVNKIKIRKGKLIKDVKLPIGLFAEGTDIADIRKKLAPAFPDFDIIQAIEEGVNKMILIRREQKIAG